MSGKPDRRDRLVYPFAMAALLGFGCAMVYGVLTDNFTALTIVMPLVLLMGGYAVGGSIVRSAKGGPRDE